MNDPRNKAVIFYIRHYFGEGAAEIAERVAEGMLTYDEAVEMACRTDEP